MGDHPAGWAQHHPFHPILDAWVAGHLAWAVSTPILLEYEDVLTRLSGPARWPKLERLMDLAERTSGNLLQVTPSFQFRVVSADPAGNLFTDCAITAEGLPADGGCPFRALGRRGLHTAPPIAAAVFRPIRRQRQTDSPMGVISILGLSPGHLTARGLVVTPPPADIMLDVALETQGESFQDTMPTALNGEEWMAVLERVAAALPPDGQPLRLCLIGWAACPLRWHGRTHFR